jgi:hypothetical protein
MMMIIIMPVVLLPLQCQLQLHHAFIVKQRTVEALVEMLDPQDYPAGEPQGVAVYLLLELVSGHHAGNMAAVFASGMGGWTCKRWHCPALGS